MQVCSSLTSNACCVQSCLTCAAALQATNAALSPAWVFHLSLLHPDMQCMLCSVLPGCSMTVCYRAGMLPLDILPWEGWAGTCRRGGGAQPGCPVARGCPQGGCSQKSQAPPREAQGPRASSGRRQGFTGWSVGCALVCYGCAQQVLDALRSCGKFREPARGCWQLRTLCHMLGG